MHHAFGIAGYSANVPTLRKFFASEDPPMTKYDHLGVMAQNGIQAALLARRGFTGDLQVLEGDIGFWRFAGAQGCDWDHFTRDLGSLWTIPEVSYKPYPVGLYSIPGIDLVRRMVREQSLRPEEIEAVEVRTHRAPETPPRPDVRHQLDAWLNPAYTMAAGVFDVRPLRSWQEPRAYGRADLLAFMPRISFGPLREGELTTTGNYWERWSPVRATIRARGTSFEGGTDYIPQMDDDQVVAKYRENVQELLRDEVAAEIERACWNLAEVKQAREIGALLRL
jgi:2-methylcitrate dehydratase PrpD